LLRSGIKNYIIMKKLLLILFIPFIVNAQQISVMDAVVLKEGSDAEYMEIEEFWSKIHADIISQGKKMQWSIWKTLPGDPLGEKPADYIIFNSYESQEQYDASQDIDYAAIAQRVHGISKKKAQKMIDSSFDPRDATRSYTLSIQAQAAVADFNPTPGLICSISLMQEKNDDYESFEKEVFKDQFQKAIDIGAQTFWGFTRVEERSENAYTQFSHICFNIGGENENTVENDFKTQKLVDLGMQSREMIPNTGSMELILLEN
tara:strand:- start:115 stop:897 length:783 start_codon:yes stop_codon:yes gene_type:complete